MRFDNSPGDTQTEPGPGRLGTEERGEEAVSHGRVDARAGIGDRQHCPSVLLVGEPNGKRTPAGHRVEGVQEEVEHDAVELVPIEGRDGRFYRQVEGQMHTLVPEPGPDEVRHLPHDATDLGGFG